MIRPATFDLGGFYIYRKIFKDIPNYEEMYQFQILENVKSLERKIYSNKELHYIQKEKF